MVWTVFFMDRLLRQIVLCFLLTCLILLPAGGKLPGVDGLQACFSSVLEPQRAEDYVREKLPILREQTGAFLRMEAWEPILTSLKNSFASVDSDLFFTHFPWYNREK